MEAQKHAVPTVVIILYNVLPHTFGFRFQFGEIEPGIIKAAVIKKMDEMAKKTGKRDKIKKNLIVWSFSLQLYCLDSVK